MTGRAVVAAFDFDGTITKRDTLVPFLRHVVGRVAVARAIAMTMPAFVAAARHRDRRDAAKEALLRRCLAGLPVERAERAAAEYASTIELRDDVRRTLGDHVRKGHEVVIVSASPALYVRAAAGLLGAHDVVATELEVRDGVLTGRYAGRNCRAEEKRRRLAAWLDGRDVELHAYGNSVDDEPMLALADHPVRV
jgi:phosphatidylglycerophosphatase C